MIDGSTRLVGLIGWPVAHSLSPLMHNEAFSDLGLNWRYVPLPVRPGALPDAVAGLAALGFRGANVTIPYKQAVIPLLDNLSPQARKIGAVNTIVVEDDGQLVGHNTDSAGFVAALSQGGFSPEGRSAVIVGAGGAGRAAVHGLISASASKILLLSRSGAEDLISGLDADDPVQARQLTREALVESVQEADLLVNATPVGMWPNVDGSIWPRDVAMPTHLTVFDLVYNPVQTLLLRQARDARARAISGLEMLLLQGAKALELWTGKRAPIEVMRDALKGGLD